MKHTYQNYKLQLREFSGNFIAVNARIKREERSQVNNLTFHIKALGKEELINLKQTKRRK